MALPATRCSIGHATHTLDCGGGPADHGKMCILWSAPLPFPKAWPSLARRCLQLGADRVLALRVGHMHGSLSVHWGGGNTPSDPLSPSSFLFPIDSGLAHLGWCPLLSISWMLGVHYIHLLPALYVQGVTRNETAPSDLQRPPAWTNSAWTVGSHPGPL